MGLYQSPNAQYDFGGPQNSGVWDSDYDKRIPGLPEYVHWTIHLVIRRRKVVIWWSKKLPTLLSKSRRLRPEDNGYGLCGLQLSGCRILCYESLDV
jgi:hypothetical protein